MMTEVCREVEQEPVLLPLSGEQLRYQTSNTQENARLDISARGFWTRGERAFFDIRVFDPTAPSYINQTLEAAHKRQENEKRRAYEERIINIEHASFTPLVFSVTGGMSTGTLKTYSRLAEMLADKRGQPRSVVTAWMRCRLSFSLLRSAILCLRGTRTRGPAIRALQDTDLDVAVIEGRIVVPRSDQT